MEPVVLKQKDRYSLQIKARYVLGRKWKQRRTNDFRLRLYLFFPRPFAINPDRFDPASFHDQITQYLRFQTPRISLRELLNRDSDVSPLARIERELAECLASNALPDMPRLQYEGRLLGTIFRTTLRDTIFVTEESEEADDDMQASAVRVVDKERLELLLKVLRRFHDLIGELRRHHSQSPVLAELALVDEFLSLSVEQFFVLFLQDEQGRAGESFASRLWEIIRSEESYRRKAGYRTVHTDVGTPQEAEEYVYRKVMLKRYSSEALHFDIRRRNLRKQAEHILYAVAAGLAMAVATTIAFYGENRFGGATTSLFLVLVAGYMVKDRIKETSRVWLYRRLGRFFPDRVLEARGQNRTMARVAVRTAFVPEPRLPQDVRDLRNRGYFERTVLGLETEHTLLYDKRIRLKSRVLRRMHNRIRGLADVNIIDCEPFLHSLTRQYDLVPEATKRNHLEVRRVRRVFHLNLIVEYESTTGRELLRYRLIVNRRGIQRVEPVPHVPGP